LIASTGVTILTVIVVALSALVLLEGLMIAEVLRQIAQLRFRLTLDDRPVPVSLGAAAGEPIPDDHVLGEFFNSEPRSGLAVFLSTDCLTCRTVAAGISEIARDMRGRLTLAVVLQAASDEERDTFLASAGLPAQLAADDRNGTIGKDLGLSVRPAAVVVRDGRTVEAAAISNANQLRQLLSPLEEDAWMEVMPAST
jgi:hypothetical protein